MCPSVCVGQVCITTCLSRRSSPWERKSRRTEMTAAGKRLKKEKERTAGRPLQVKTARASARCEGLTWHWLEAQLRLWAWVVSSGGHVLRFHLLKLKKESITAKSVDFDLVLVSPPFQCCMWRGVSATAGGALRSPSPVQMRPCVSCGSAASESSSQPPVRLNANTRALDTLVTSGE